MLQNLFSFATLRGVAKPETIKDCLHYIQDEEVIHYGEEVKRVKRNFYIPNEDLHPNNPDNDSQLTIPQLIYKRIFCDPPPYNSLRNVVDYEQGNNVLVSEVLRKFTYPISYSCDAGYADITYITEYPYINDEEAFRIIYNNPGGQLSSTLLQINAFLKEFLSSKDHKNFTQNNQKAVIKKIEAILELPKGSTIIDFVFAERGYTENFRQAKRQYFENLYALYILRRLQSIDLEPIITLLRTLYLLELLAEDYALNYSHPNQQVRFVLEQLRQVHPNRYFVELDDLNSTLLNSTVVIHPMFAQLHYLRKKFNPLKPIGIADLKIVKSKLIGYKANEISHIHNIMKGEANEYTFRELNKTQEVFSFTSDSSSSTQRENQSTDKNELKREIDSVLKTDLSVNANSSVSLKYGIITNATVSAGIAFSSSKSDSVKAASELLSETIEKAVNKVETKTSQTRSSTKLFETESNNKHSFLNNLQDSKHISGIFRWVDKIYEAQVYNYGKRLMYEFIIPEPALFYVKSKLTNYTLFDLQCPEEPPIPNYQQVNLRNPNQDQELIPEHINKSVFQALSRQYDLSEFTFPEEKKKAILVDQSTGSSTFSQRYGASKDHQLSSDNFNTTGIEVGYDIELIRTSGQILFFDQASEANIPSEKNLYVLYINGQQIDFDGRNINTFPQKPAGMDAHMIYTIGEHSKNIRPDGAKLTVADGKVSVVFLMNDVNFYLFQIELELKINPNYLFSWQTKVYNKIKAIEQLKVDQINLELQQDFNAAKSEYRNKKATLESSNINDLLQGKQESYNAKIIETELKKHCISFLAKEFDATEWDDRLQEGAIKESSPINFSYPKFNQNSDNCGFQQDEVSTTIPLIQLDSSSKRGSFVQFIEQAFEWDKLSYIFYSYFWADRPKWLEMLYREDRTDNNMTAFLQAGSARVLVAVHPAYNNAVLHFLATGQTWEGGTSPAVDDPLFIPLFEEIRDTQDNMQDAIPEGEPYRYTLGTQLVYLQDSSSALPQDFE